MNVSAYCCCGDCARYTFILTNNRGVLLQTFRLAKWWEEAGVWVAPLSGKRGERVAGSQRLFRNWRPTGLMGVLSFLVKITSTCASRISGSNNVDFKALQVYQESAFLPTQSWEFHIAVAFIPDLTWLSPDSWGLFALHLTQAFIKRVCFCFLDLFQVDPRIMPFLWDMIRLNSLPRIASFLFPAHWQWQKGTICLVSYFRRCFLSVDSVVLVLVSLTNQNSQQAFCFCPKITVFTHSLSFNSIKSSQAIRLI